MTLTTLPYGPAAAALIRSLAEEHWQESGFKGALSWDAALGLPGFVVVSSKGKEVLGYVAVMVVPSHLSGQLVAHSDATYMRPQSRGSLAAGKLLKAAEAEAASQGATEFHWHLRPGTPAADALTRRGYRPTDITLTKELPCPNSPS